MTCDCGWKLRPGGMVIDNGKGGYSCPDCKKDLFKVKPPLGLKPRKTVENERGQEILSAMSRYIEADKAIPQEWLDELQKYGEC